MPLDDTTATWILRDNLRLFLERVSARVGSRFDDWDWDAIRFGIQDTDYRQDRWYEYELIGTPSVALAFAVGEGADRLCIRVQTESSMATKISAIARIMECRDPSTSLVELEILIQVAFVEISRPNDDKIVACTAAHLAICPECQEVLTFFRNKHWLTLAEQGVQLPHYYAGPAFLTPAAMRCFFPAYLIHALRDEDEELLDLPLRRTESVNWTPLQSEIIEFARYLLKQANEY